MIKVATVKEFRDNATRFLRSKEPVIIVRRGSVAGMYISSTGSIMPEELRHELFLTLSNSVAKQLRNRRIKEEDILEEFEARRQARRRR